MFRSYKLSFLAAGLMTALVACHSAVPAQSAISASAAVQCADASAAPASDGRDARETVGFAPRTAAPAPCLTGNAAKPAAAAPNGDDPIWRLDMP
jgi:hypothetical protein